MSNTFNSNRLFALITRQWISFGKIYLMSIGIAAGIIAAFYGYALYEFNGMRLSGYAIDSGILNFRIYLFMFLGLFFVTVISGTYFNDYGQRPKAIFEVLIPASRLEKFLTALFYTVIVCLLSYIAVFLLIDFGVVSYMRKHTTISTTYQADGYTLVRDNLAYFIHYETPKEAAYFYFLPFLLNAIFLLGSVAYRNFQYIKTAVSFIVYIAIWSFATVYIMKALTESSVAVQRNSYWNNDDHVLQLFLLVGVVVTVIFWGLGFLRLKEKEV